MVLHDLRIRTKRGWCVLRYQDGQEAAAVEQIMAWAEDPALGFTWLDAANMSWKVVDSAADQYDEIGQQIAKMMGKANN